MTMGERGVRGRHWWGTVQPPGGFLLPRPNEERGELETERIPSYRMSGLESGHRNAKHDEASPPDE